MLRTAFLVDGFNLYHSLVEAQHALQGRGTRWLDLRSLCASFLPHIDTAARLGPAVLVTGDSDITPGVRCALRLFPEIPAYACFPYNRQSLELKAASSGALRITKEAYARHQFSDPIVLPGGRSIRKPVHW